MSITVASPEVVRGIDKLHRVERPSFFARIQHLGNKVMSLLHPSPEIIGLGWETHDSGAHVRHLVQVYDWAKEADFQEVNTVQPAKDEAFKKPEPVMSVDNPTALDFLLTNASDLKNFVS